MQRLDQITFTRFMMVLLVLFFHDTGGIYTAAINVFPISELLRSAPTAVSYLYVLSGFVMSLVYFRPGEKFDVLGYWKARIARIYPLYIISFALICIYYADSLFRIKPQKILANLFVVQAWFPAYAQSFNYSSWSMTVEFFFYAVFPFFVFWAYRQSTRKLIWVSMIVWVVSQTIHFLMWRNILGVYSDFINYFPLFHLNSFILGVVGGIWYLREGRGQPATPWMVITAAAGSFLLIAVYTIVSSGVWTALPHRMEPMGGLLSPIMILFIVSLAMDRSLLSRTLSRPVFVNLGEASYALYILHVPLFWLYERWLENSGFADPERIFALTFLPIMIAVALLAHFFVDIPLRRWFRNLLQRISLRLALIDIGILSLVAFTLFRWRFGDGREYQSYREMERLLFWAAFFIRPLLSIGVGACSRELVYAPIFQMLRPLLISQTVSSLAITAIIYAGYAAGWFENFPRSIFVLDWLLILLLSLLARLAFRGLRIYKPDTVQA
ncbi:MAG: acyltransferase [Chloroflexi bacterium]|nr:acyltransferase [Chloroflexota bacterium]